MKTAILGSSGYVGGELLRLLAGHSEIEVIRAFASSNAGEPFARVHPHLSLAYADRRFDAWTSGAIDGCELIFAALPHGQTQKLADELIGSGARIVDLGADFRLDSPEEYERWYGEPHARPELLERFVYGLPEFHREAIEGARFVAAPGCYPTAASLALRPLVDSRIASREGLIVDAASGVSGAGRGARATTHFCGVDGSLRAYGLLNHAAASLRPATRGRPAPAIRSPFCARLMPASRSFMLATRRPKPNGPAGPTPPF
ncbi:MAG: N-acetyl-gamma-glutamyl-phosphate reductase [Sphingomonadales bacterium]|nr:N-acetyl-gamma-glutamyl-phosphate reductase [Sphingomonadales bacterium]